jgi:DNA-binding MurR/RpiR family transcriptional regulator
VKFKNRLISIMVNRQQIQEIPGALRLTLEKAHAEFGAVVRKVRWGDGPVYICGAGDCAALAQAAAYGFELFPGWPVIARPVQVFQTYALSLLRPRSILVIISAEGEWPEAQELVHTAHQRGCTVVALANHPESPLAKLSDYVLLTRAEGATASPTVAVCLHLALNFLALETARTLKRPDARWDLIEKDFDLLPDKIEWAFTQLTSVVRAAAEELVGFTRIQIVGGGFYHYPAWRAARQLQALAVLNVKAVEATEFMEAPAQFATPNGAVLLLSGSHSKIKKLLHRCAFEARANGSRVFSLTDSNDRDLAESSHLGVLVPLLLEPPGSTLTLFMLEWLAMETRRRAEPLEKPNRQSPNGESGKL